MDNLVDKMVEQTSEQTCYTPESIAWKLLMDDVDQALASKVLVYDPDNSSNGNINSYMFELLITIFMEMIFDMALLFDAEEKEQQNTNNYKFNPDLKKFDLNIFLPTLSKKMNHLSILLKTEVYNKKTDDNKVMQQILNDRYCRVILRHDKNDAHYFKQNNISPELNYHMILNSVNANRNYKNLKDVYAVIMLNDNLYVIAFDKIETFSEVNN